MTSSQDLHFSFASVQSTFTVHRFAVRERLSELFEVSLLVWSNDRSLSLDALSGELASFSASNGLRIRMWTGVCRNIRQVAVERDKALYRVFLVPALWLLTQRRNHRIFRHMTIPDIVREMLGEWNIEPVLRIDESFYPERNQRVQYGETDFAFLSRLLEEAGISFSFEDDIETGSSLVLHDRPAVSGPRLTSPLPFVASRSEDPGPPPDLVDLDRTRRTRLWRDRTLPELVDRLLEEWQIERVWAVEPEATADRRTRAQDDETDYAFLHRLLRAAGMKLEVTAAGGDTAAGHARATVTLSHDTAPVEAEGEHVMRVQQHLALGPERTDAADEVSFATTRFDLAPGAGFSIEFHPVVTAPLLITAMTFEGEAEEEWSQRGTAVPAAAGYTPPRTTPKPRIHGVQSAVVISPDDEEIHTDAEGRVKIRFHWERDHGDREQPIWVPVSQAWAGDGYGLFSLPRTGHEVLVAFVEGDPDQPVIVGRVHNALSPVPYPLPEHQATSGWRSRSSPGGEGANEIRFEDDAGKERLSLQAERDLVRMVKREQRVETGEDRLRWVAKDEMSLTGQARRKEVANDETQLFGEGRTLLVGEDRHALVGGRDVHHVGQKFVVRIAPSLSLKVPAQLAMLEKNTLGPLLEREAEETLGTLPVDPRGGIDLEPQLPPVPNQALDATSEGQVTLPQRISAAVREIDRFVTSARRKGAKAAAAASQQQPGASPLHPGASEQQPGASEQQPGASQQQPGASQQQPGASEQQPGASPLHPGASEQQPGASQQQPGASQQEPSAAIERGGQTRLVMTEDRVVLSNGQSAIVLDGSDIIFTATGEIRLVPRDQFLADKRLMHLMGVTVVPEGESVGGEE
jgi:type VI secretion system secreted protein VgrG